MTDWRDFEIEQTGQTASICDCCGNVTTRIWGAVHEGDMTVAAYFVTWTKDKPDHGATFDLVLGSWGDATDASDRYSAALDFRIIDGTPQFMVVDAQNRLPNNELFASSLKRSEIIETPTASQIFTIIDAIYLSKNCAELQSWASS